MPALLIRWIDDPSITSYDLSSLRVIQSGGQRLQPEVRLRAERALPGCFIQENFGMAEGLIMFVRSSDPPAVRRETCGRPEEAENLILGHEAVLNVACVPYPDPARGADVRLRGAAPRVFLVAGRAGDVPGRVRDGQVQAAGADRGAGFAAAVRVRQYFPPSLRTDIRGRLREKIMFGSDHPSLP